MPPKAKFTVREIVEAAVEITRKKGIGAVTAREIGAYLGVSTRPLFTYFNTVEDLKKEVYQFAEELYKEYIERGLKNKIPSLGVGQQYLIFARKEPELYRFLFLSPPEGVTGGVVKFLRLSQDLVRDSVMKTYNMDAQTADCYFRDLWLVAYSFTTLIVTGECPYTDDEIGSIFTEFSLAVCKAYKEVPGLADGKFDRDAIFGELVKK